jgi:hypothetical protein
MVVLKIPIGIVPVGKPLTTSGSQLAGNQPIAAVPETPSRQKQKAAADATPHVYRRTIPRQVGADSQPVLSAWL